MKTFKNLWVIGNGFDLSCGLKTRYWQFLDYYLKTSKDYIEKARELNKNKNQAIFFKTKNPLAEVFGEPMNINRDTLFSLDYYIRNYDASVIKQFKAEIASDDNSDVYTWSDLELKLGRISKDFDSYEIFGLCVDDLHLALNEYLFEKDEEAKLKGVIELPEEVCHVFDTIDMDNTVFIILNYTKIFERFIRSRYPNANPNIVYLHGTVEDGNTVLGVGIETQIFNIDFAQNPEVTQRLLKIDITGNGQNVFYEDFSNFLYSNLGFTRDEVNIFGCSMGGSDMFLWYSFLERFLQEKEGTGKVHVYDAYAESEDAKINEIICGILFFFSSSYDSSEITSISFNELIEITEEYIMELEKRHVPKSDRLLNNYQRNKTNDSMGEYLDSIDKYLVTLETEFGVIDDYSNKIGSIITRLNNIAEQAESDENISTKKKIYEELDKIISDDELVMFQNTLDDFNTTGKLSVPFLGMEPGIYDVHNEPLRTILYHLLHKHKGYIKMIIAENKGIPVAGLKSAITAHTYSFQALAKFANEKCMGDINKAIDKIANSGKNEEIIFNEDLSEGNPLYQEPIRYAVRKIKNILVYHKTFKI